MASLVLDPLLTATPGTPSRESRRGLLLREIAIIAAAMLLFGVFVHGLLRWYFPAGAGLDIVARDGAAASDRAAEMGHLGDSKSLPVGSIAERRNDVQHRPAAVLDWRRAQLGGELRARDSLQTGVRSSAVVRSESGERFVLSEKSLVVFEPGSNGAFVNFARPIAVLMQGELGGEVLATADGAGRVVKVATGSLSVIPDAGQEAAEFAVVVNANRSATINVYSGHAKFESQQGSVEVNRQQALTVSDTGAKIALVDLPPPPDLRGPASGSTFEYRKIPEPIRFHWSAVSRAEGYRLQIARDAAFRDLVTDETTTETHFNHGNLGVGRYYWQVRSRLGTAQGSASKAREVRVGRDSRPPTLELGPLPKVTSERSITVSGRTESDARVYVGGKPATVTNGTFQAVTHLEAGANVIVIESVDSVGNVAYRSVVVTAK